MSTRFRIYPVYRIFVAMVIFSLLMFYNLNSIIPTTVKVDFLKALPQFDLTGGRNKTHRFIEIKKKMANLPDIYLTPDLDLKVNPECATYPDLFDLKFHNSYWQLTTNSNGTNFYLYAAYLDVREKNPLGPAIRILGMIDKVSPQETMHCQIWFDSTESPVTAKVAEYKYVWNKGWGSSEDGRPQLHITACKIPKEHQNKVPSSVSLVESPCDKPTTNLRVVYNKHEGPKHKFGICTKAMYFATDESAKLVEWLEIVKRFGAHQVHMYNHLEVHPNVRKVWDYYTKSGFVELTPMTLPGSWPNIPGLQDMFLQAKIYDPKMSKYVWRQWQFEIMPLNDCFYRNMYRYDLIALLDIDEVPVPVHHDNWHLMMKDVEAKSLKEDSIRRAGFNFRNAFFIDEMLESNREGYFQDIPPYLHMVQHVYRSINLTAWGASTKCFHNPENVLSLHNHFAMECLEGASCSSFSVDTDTAVLQHYRQGCRDGLADLSCAKEDTVMDNSLWKWKEDLVAAVTHTFVSIGLFD